MPKRRKAGFVGTGQEFADAGFYRDNDKAEKEELFLLRGLALLDINKIDYPAATLPIVAKLGAMYHRLGKSTKAEPYFRRALDCAEMAFGKDHAKTAAHIESLAGCLVWVEKADQAAALYNRAIAVREAASDPAGSTLFEDIEYLGLLQLALKNTEEAVPLLRKSLTMRDDEECSLQFNVLDGFFGLSTCWKKLQFLRGNESDCLRALDVLTREKQGESVAAGLVVAHLGLLSARKFQWQQAQERFESAIDMLSGMADRDDPQLELCLSNLAWLYRVNGREEDALGVDEEIKAIQISRTESAKTETSPSGLSPERVRVPVSTVQARAVPNRNPSAIAQRPRRVVNDSWRIPRRVANHPVR